MQSGCGDTLNDSTLCGGQTTHITEGTTGSIIPVCGHGEQVLIHSESGVKCVLVQTQVPENITQQYLTAV